MADGKITECTAVGNDETPGIGSNAIEQLPAAIVAAGSADVDGVTGATFTSDAVKAAVRAALDQANGKTAAAAFAAGTYRVSAMGCNGLIELDVTLGETTIEAITVVSEKETIGIGDEAIEKVAGDIVAYQTLDVDTVSSATLSSNAIKSAVADALTQAGGDASVLKAIEKPAEAAAEDCTAEAVIIGGGAAGMTAAIKAAQKGVKVILLEKMDLLGGTSVMAGVGTQAGGSKLQLAKENPYTADEFFEYLKGLGHKEEKIPTAAPISEDYAYTLAYRSGEMMDWLSEIGLPMQATAEHSNAHSLSSKENGLFGEQLVRALKEQLTAAGVEVRMASRATEIVMENGAVAGVKVSSPNGDYTIRTSYAAICTGGYGGGVEALKGGYIISDSKKETPDMLLMASGSEVEQCVGAQAILAEQGIDARVISMPSFELFDAQSEEYKESVMPKAVRKRVAVEAAASFGWHKYVGLDGETVTLDHFGASAPAKLLFKEYGFTNENVAAVAKRVFDK